MIPNIYDTLKSSTTKILQLIHPWTITNEGCTVTAVEYKT
jgi:hypothetical protein